MEDKANGFLIARVAFEGLEEAGLIDALCGVKSYC